MDTVLRSFIFMNQMLFSKFKQLWRTWFSRSQVIQRLEHVQDFIIIALCVGLFSIMLIRLGMMFKALLELRDFQEITADILFILILVELFRLLIIYLKEQRISVGTAVEVSLVSVLREVILQGVLDIPVFQLLGICAFLSILGGLLFLRTWMFWRFDNLQNPKNTAHERQNLVTSDSEVASNLNHQYPF